MPDNTGDIAYDHDFPMVDKNIICFAKDMGEDPTSCNHVLNGLARYNRVLWLNSISTRSPNLGSGRDLGKIFRKIKASLAATRQISDQMWLYTPLVLPFHHRPWAVKLNRLFLRWTFRRLRRKLGMTKYQLWTFVPTSSPYLSALDADKIIYYCTDNWSSFSSVDGSRIADMMGDQARQADLVFATSHSLMEKLKEFNPNTHLAAHGVNYSQFAHALDDDLPLPADVADLKGPVLGFYGLIEDWMDHDLLCYLAEKHADWNIVLVGKVCVDTTRMDRFPNIHMVGRKQHSELPAYCKAFTVGLIPHIVNDLTRHMNPIKLREYLSAGLPIVSTNLPEVLYYGEHCAVTHNYDEFEEACAAAIRDNTPEARRRRSESMKNETWEARLKQIGQIIRDNAM